MRIAGAGEPVFLPEAVDLVFQYSKGIPRTINLICEQSMIFGYAEQVKPIPAHFVESVGLELDLVQHPFTISFSAMQALMTRSSHADMLNTITPVANRADSPKERVI